MRSIFLLFPLVVCCFFQQSQIKAQGNFFLNNGCIDDATVFVAFTGETEINTCAGDGESDRIRFATSTLAQSFGYVVVDENDIIVSIGFSNFIDFEMLPQGVLRVFAFSTLGFITAQVGEDFNTAQLSVPCFGLTTNFVTVNNGTTGASTISTTTGQDTISICASDGLADLVNFESDNTTPSVAFVVTDTANAVLAIDTSGTIDFEGSGAGICRVWSVGFSTDLPLAVGDTLTPGNGCNSVSSNFIVLDRTSLAGASVLTADSSQMVTTCPGDGQADVIDFILLNDTVGTQSLVVTDGDGNILVLPPGTTVDFEGAGAGICRVYVLTFDDELMAEEGENIDTDTLASGCYALSEEFVVVDRRPTEGGIVRAVGNLDTVSVCPDSGGESEVTFISFNASGGDFVYLVTDDNNIVLGVSEDPTISFDNATFGTCRVWGLSFRGDLLVEEGDDAANTQLASECFGLSENFTTVLREEVSGGTIALEDGTTEVTICPDDNLADILTFTVSDNDGPSFAYLITTVDNIITGFTDEASIDFTGITLENLRVWGLTYSGMLNMPFGSNAETDNLATGCFALSDNFISISSVSPLGGSISTVAGEQTVTTCPGDGAADEIDFEVSGNSAPNFTLIVTDDNGMIIGIPPGLTVDFEDAGDGICRVYGLSYFGDLLAAVGANLDDQLSEGCFALTDDLVTVHRIESNGGIVRAQGNLDTVSICPESGGDSEVTFLSFNASGGDFVYLVTDENNIVLGISEDATISFDNAVFGICRVWGLSFRGDLLVEEGDDAANTQLASECFGLSENFVTVIREEVSGGTISLDDGSTEITICSEDNLADILTFVLSDNSGPSVAYLITTVDNIITGFTDDPSIDFSSITLENFRVWGLTYSGMLNTPFGSNAETDNLATGCFALSDNFVSIASESPEGGIVTTADGEDTVTTCPGDGNADIITFAVTGNTATNFSLIVTDDDGVIIGTPAGLTVDFDDAGLGICRVYGIAYEGALLATMGDQIDTDQLAEGCFALTDNFTTVIRENPDGGTVSTEDGLTSLLICPN
ncbi:MAG: hypothetical protein AAF741_17815, partial [Bacteroidota bacterium]